MVDTKQPANYKLLGAGRSGRVYLIDTPKGKIARKVFFEDKLASLVHYLFFGVPNPYVWNQDAIACAFYRRKILKELVKFWFDSQLRIADALQRSWNAEFHAYQLDTEFIQGRHVSLHQPFDQNQGEEVHTLVHKIMLPLQRYLIQSGFDGFVWQAGKGSPKALNNFLLETQTTQSELSFVCIDVESGVPALFPLNIWTLFSFYLPKSFKHRSALFDDVDIPKLKQYISDHKYHLEDKISISGYTELLENVECLEYHQKRWKSLNRFHRSIQYQLYKGYITEEQANWYVQNPLIWYIRELGRIIFRIVKFIFVSLPVKILRKLIKINYLLFFKRLGKFIFSQRYRLQMSRDYVSNRIQNWQKRKQLTTEEADSLFSRLASEHSSSYLSDFGVHLGIKAFFMWVEIVFAPLLYSAGIINEVVLMLWLVLGGPIYRTVYTVYRMFQEAKEGQDIPWVALFVGFIPTFGVLAYPCQMIYSATGRRSKVSQFIVYDFFSGLGIKIPIWGGEDTLTEHFFNNCANSVIRWFKERAI